MIRAGTMVWLTAGQKHWARISEKRQPFAFDGHFLRRFLRVWTARQARSHVRTNLAAERASKLATFGRQSLGVRHSAE